ncbi:MAG: M48 family metalloprotease [Planctomycetota bacterium]
MDFFGHQEAARRATKRLVVLYVLALAAIVASIHLAASFAFALGDRGGPRLGTLLLLVTAATLAVVGVGALVRMLELRRGGPAVAELLGGRAVPLRPTDPKERLLRNLVEEMAIASGTPIPALYVLDDETGLNAFAAGWTPDDAAVAVTRGCLDELDRDELQGVIAHEFSHVFHGDMRLNIRLMGALAGIVCLVTIGRVLARVGGRSRGNRKNNAAAFALFGVLLVAIGWIGVLFARLIQAAVSRQREYLADASAVQYTRNPLGIGMALARIGDRSARIQNVRAEEASHMLFADGMGRMFGSLLASHPPIAERIARVLPGFAAASRPRRSLQADVAALAPAPARADALRRSAPDALVAAFGEPQAADVAAARDLLAGLPLTLAQAAHAPESAKALVCALLLADDPALRAAQTALLPADAALRHDAQALRLPTRAVGATARLPLLTLALPALRGLPVGERRPLRAALQALAGADGALAPFEWALLRLADRALAPDADGRVRRPTARKAPLYARADAVATVLSLVARTANFDDDQRAAAAFRRGGEALDGLPGLRLRPAAECTLDALGVAVDALAEVTPLAQRNRLAACAAAAASDGAVQPAEAELLRALAAIWDCPLPLAVAN